MTRIVVDDATSPWVAKAVEQLCPPGGGGLEFRSMSLGATAEEVVDVGLLLLLRGDSTDLFFRPFDGMWERGIRRFVLWMPDDADAPWSNMPPPQQGAFREMLSVCGARDWASLQAMLHESATRGGSEWAELRVRTSVDARRMHLALRRFMHGSKEDIANRLLAPARLLLMLEDKQPGLSQRSKWNEMWTADVAGFLWSAADGGYRAPGVEFARAAEPVTAWLADGEPACGDAPLSRLLALLTEYRVLSGQKSVGGSRPVAAVPVLPLMHSASAVPAHCPRYRVLVVDDHGANWRPVFEVLQQRLCGSGMWVDFDFSTDGRESADADNSLAPFHAGAYDLVFLDIFLGELDGRDILKEWIRPDLIHKPVLLWTTSRDDEVTSKASLANGLLLKKTVTWKDLEDSVTCWLPEGRAKGQFSLPSPFFNHTIVDPVHRDLARDFTDWCLKQLDSFHALDPTYFRYFTDHGGRHIVKVLEFMEQALSPFLARQDDSVLPQDPESRKFELLALYLAVVAHELGMFPMRREDGEEGFGELGDEYMDTVRGLHAVRGMLLLSGGPDGKDSYWSDGEGRNLWERFNKLEHPKLSGLRLGDVLAVLVLYHSRFLRSLRESDFLVWTGEASERLKAATSVTVGFPDGVFEGTLNALQARLSPVTHCSFRNRLRGQSSLLRFVDAIDVASTRNPALFLIHSKHRSQGLDPGKPAHNNREYLKRQVCKSVALIDGKVNVVVRARAPEPSFLTQVTLAMAALGIWDEAKGGPLKDFAKGVQSLNAPWGGQSIESAKAFHAPLNKWLLEAWLVLKGSGAPAFREHLVKIEIVQEIGGFSWRGKQLFASLTGLSVACEILDEYQAVIDGNLEKDIRVGEFKWQDDEWRGTDPPAALTMLGPAMGF